MVIESINVDQEGWYRHQAIDSRGSAVKDVYIKVVPGEQYRTTDILIQSLVATPELYE